MNETNHEINLALRTAAGHERAAREAEEQGAKTYEMKMISAGASAYGAFTLAIKAAPEYQGRKIDDKAILRIYQSNKPRPWWDAHLAKVKVEGKPVDREWGKRLIQWHIDPDAAKARRALTIANAAAQRKKLKDKVNSASRGERSPRRAEPTRATAQKVTEVATAFALAGRELPRIEPKEAVTVEDLLGEVNRIGSAVRKVKADARLSVLEVLRVTAREIEGYVR